LAGYSGKAEPEHFQSAGGSLFLLQILLR